MQIIPSASTSPFQQKRPQQKPFPRIQPPRMEANEYAVPSDATIRSITPAVPAIWVLGADRSKPRRKVPGGCSGIAQANGAPPNLVHPPWDSIPPANRYRTRPMGQL